MLDKAKIRKTGKTKQFEVLEEGYSRKHKCVFAKGVYNSFNADDARPGAQEFYVETAKVSFGANSLPEALELWVKYRETAKASEVTSIQSIG